jgi:hypothetical protein
LPKGEVIALAIFSVLVYGPLAVGVQLIWIGRPHGNAEEVPVLSQDDADDATIIARGRVVSDRFDNQPDSIAKGRLPRRQRMAPIGLRKAPLPLAGRLPASVLYLMAWWITRWKKPNLLAAVGGAPSAASPLERR